MGEALELFLDMAAPRSHHAFDLLHNIGGAVWCREHLVVSAGTLLVSIASDADDVQVIDALRLTSETIDAGPASPLALVATAR